jgi:phosphatidylserine/phosphatidylglycerophosphate/cardiolipin synthase-like enzyme
VEDDEDYGDDENELDQNAYIYSEELKKSHENLAFIKNLPLIQRHLNNMPQYMSEGFRKADVRLVHQLSNLITTDVTTKALENVERNPNSILYLFNKIIENREAEGDISGTLQIVSPYLFSGKYRDEDGKVVYDGAKRFRELLEANPNMKLEVITNSVLTSDNFITQAIIDMDMVPRFLLTPELQKVWRSSVEKGEFNPQIVESEEWKRLINHPQIFIYQTGRLDSNLLGGPTQYGKLHAKFITGENGGFIGTSNFDYRSNLYNNEMGYFFRGKKLRQDLADSFELLKATSYRWGTPEWLQMRKELMQADTKKSGPARKQRGIYKTVKALGLEYLM